MDLSAISYNSLDIQSLITNGLSGSGRTTNGYDINDKTAYYAEKGEPMYMADMDADEDGVVTLDEFRDYCKSKGMATRDIVKMSQLASAFRTMKAENEAIDYISKLIPNVHPNLRQADNESGNLKESGNQFNISNDTDSSKIVNYDEYMKYCEQNVVNHELKSNTAVEETENGKLEITNSGKAIESYEKSEGYGLKSTFEELV